MTREILSKIQAAHLSFQAVRGMLDNPNEPVSDLSYFDCIESVMENSKVGLHIKQPKYSSHSQSFTS